MSSETSTSSLGHLADNLSQQQCTKFPMHRLIYRISLSRSFLRCCAGKVIRPLRNELSSLVAGSEGTQWEDSKNCLLTPSWKTGVSRKRVKPAATLSYEPQDKGQLEAISRCSWGITGDFDRWLEQTGQAASSTTLLMLLHVQPVVCNERPLPQVVSSWHSSLPLNSLPRKQKNGLQSCTTKHHHYPTSTFSFLTVSVSCLPAHK